jgi:hypothetical protein
MLEGRPGRGGGGGAPLAIVTKNVGINRFVWDVRHSNGLGAPPASYQARLTVDGKMLVQPFNVLIDPNLAEEGLTAADLQEQFNHNVRMRELTTAVGVQVGRAREMLSIYKSDPVKLKQVETVVEKLVTPQTPRYSKPGLQSHITYLAGMTNAADQKVGRDALERYAVLKKELEAIISELDKIK